MSKTTKEVVSDFITSEDNVELMKDIKDVIYDKLGENETFQQFSNDIQKYSELADSNEDDNNT